jgi:GxxExxY protein
MRWDESRENDGSGQKLAPRRQDAKGGSSSTTENGVARIVVDAAVRVHQVLGPGLLESVYEIVLAFELRRRGLHVARQVPIDVVYENLRIDGGFRADLMVEGCVLVELKSVERTAPVHKKQTLTYLRLANLRLGLLLNFGAALMKDGVTRLVNGLPDDLP